MEGVEGEEGGSHHADQRLAGGAELLHLAGSDGDKGCREEGGEEGVMSSKDHCTSWGMSRVEEGARVAGGRGSQDGGSYALAPAPQKGDADELKEDELTTSSADGRAAEPGSRQLKGGVEVG